MTLFPVKSWNCVIGQVRLKAHSATGGDGHGASLPYFTWINPLYRMGPR